MTPGILRQIALVAGLRWRILRNGLRKKNNRADLIGMLLAAFFSLMLVVVLSFVFYGAGYSFSRSNHLNWMAVLYWVVSLFWLVFPILAAGFGSHFDFRNLLRFPLSLPAFYALSLAYGLVDFPAVASVIWLSALTAGAAQAQPRILPALLLALVTLVALNVTVERLVISWLNRLLARRRSREVFFALFILSMISLQLITPLRQRYVHARPPDPERVLSILSPFPPSLAAGMVSASSEHRFASVLFSFGGLLLFLAAFSFLLWMRLMAQYRGELISESPAPVRVTPARALVSGRGADVLNLLPPLVGAVLRKEWFYFTRNGFAFLLLLIPPMQVLLFSSAFGGNHSLLGQRGQSSDLLFPGMMSYVILILIGPAYNAFSYEGRGIQTYFTAPVKFREIFLGKNLLFVGLATVEVAVCASLLAFRTRLPSAPILFATLTAVIFNVFVQLPLANWSSLSFPRKLEFGSMRSRTTSGVAVWLMFGAQLVIGAASAFILFVGRWTGNRWLPGEIFIVLAAAALAGYFASLQALTESAEKKKESLIEALCR